MNRKNTIQCAFKTDRLTIHPLNEEVDINILAHRTQTILSPEVTQSLPPGWQSIDDQQKAIAWIKERATESQFLLVKTKSNEAIIGFIFLYLPDKNDEDEIELRFGYLFGKESWGKGIGTETLRGFVNWAHENGHIKSISGGVEKTNIGSIKVLEKVGFRKLNEDTSDTIFYQYTFH